MSFIEIYKAKQSQFAYLQKVESFTLRQVIPPQGTQTLNQFIVENANSLFVEALIQHVSENSKAIIKAIMQKASDTLDKARIEAKAEAEAIASQLGEEITVKQMEAEVQILPDK